MRSVLESRLARGAVLAAVAAVMACAGGHGAGAERPAPVTAAPSAVGAAADCTPGARQCAGETPRECDSAGRWKDAPACSSLAWPNVASAACEAGDCRISSCSPGYANCDGDPGNGCEARFAALEVAAGRTHSCARDRAGAIWCWGDNRHGQLGDGTTEQRTTPVLASAFGAGNRAVAAGEAFTCVIDPRSKVRCLGINHAGQLGNGQSGADVLEARPVLGLDGDARTLVVGSWWHSCAIQRDGSIGCWGANRVGQLGVRTKEWFSSRAEKLKGLGLGVTSLALGGAHTCATKSDASLWCWGSNQYGQLGDGTRSDRRAPTRVVVPGIGAASAAAGEAHTCATDVDGSLFCWGLNQHGSLGFAGPEAQTKPEPVGVSSELSQVVAGAHHTCASSANSLWCFGQNNFGQAGVAAGEYISRPTRLAGFDSPPALAGGGWHFCAREPSGAVSCWGDNRYGQLGDGTTLPRSIPALVSFTCAGAGAHR